MFKELLLPVENFEFVSHSWQHFNASNNFVIHPVEGGLWRILMLNPNSDFITANFFTLKHATQNAFILLEKHKEQYPKFDFSYNMKRQTRYTLNSKPYPQVECMDLKVMRKVGTEDWALKKIEGVVGETHNFPTSFNSRKEVLSFLHRYLSQNLLDIYTDNIEKHGQNTDNILQAVQTDNFVNLPKWLWWMMFIRPEVQLHHLFK